MIGNALGLWMLSALAVFLLIYLRRPKPYRQMLPSLMFLLGDRQRTQRFKFLRNFFSHLLFFLQLLAVVLLSLVAAEPSLSREFEAQSQGLADHLCVYAERYQDLGQAAAAFFLLLLGLLQEIRMNEAGFEKSSSYFLSALFH